MCIILGLYCLDPLAPRLCSMLPFAVTLTPPVADDMKQNLYVDNITSGCMTVSQAIQYYITRSLSL